MTRPRVLLACRPNAVLPPEEWSAPLDASSLPGPGAWLVGSDGKAAYGVRLEQRHQNYVDALALVGLDAVVVTSPEHLSPDLVGGPTGSGGLLLLGGPDIAPSRYGQAPHPTTCVDDELDVLEWSAYHLGRTVGIPTLAICRGLQVVNVAHGGTLVQDLPSMRPSSVAHAGEEGAELREVIVHHDVHVEPGTRLAEILGTTNFTANSHHHQAIDQLGEGLDAVAWAPDGIIEAAAGTGSPWLLAVQFHPERMMSESIEARRLFRAFAEAVSARVRAQV